MSGSHIYLLNAQTSLYERGLIFDEDTQISNRRWAQHRDLAIRWGNEMGPKDISTVVPSWISQVYNPISVQFYPKYFEEFYDEGVLICHGPRGKYLTIGEFKIQDWRAAELAIRKVLHWEESHNNRYLCYKNLRTYLNKISLGWFNEL